MQQSAVSRYTRLCVRPVSRSRESLGSALFSPLYNSVAVTVVLQRLLLRADNSYVLPGLIPIFINIISDPASIRKGTEIHFED